MSRSVNRIVFVAENVIGNTTFSAPLGGECVLTVSTFAGQRSVIVYVVAVGAWRQFRSRTTTSNGNRYQPLTDIQL